MSPTYEYLSGFARELERLPREQRRAFRAAVVKLIEALKDDREPPRSLRIKRVQGTREVWEMSYSGDGRATFRYGSEVRPGETHVVWLRVGGHEILSRPE
jgi:mRNA-degrading endonuclease RelE of RelBE toxin-antitoxin system